MRRATTRATTGETRLTTRLTPAEVAALAREIQANGVESPAGRAARNRLVEANLGLVARRARHYAAPAEKTNLTYEDCWQEGVIGLMHAAETFDPARGFRFSTHANWWIRQEMGRALQMTGHTIRLPVHLQEAQFRVWRDGEAASAARDVARAQRWRHVATPPLSLDAPLAGDDENGNRNDAQEITLLGHLIADRACDVAQEATLRVDTAIIEQLAARILSPREREAVRLSVVNELTLDAAGRRMGCSRERVRQLTSMALRKLRAALGVAPTAADAQTARNVARKAACRAAWGRRNTEHEKKKRTVM